MNEDKIKVYSTEEGKLYIKPIELFALPHVQELILRIANKEAGQNKQDAGKNLACDVCQSNKDIQTYCGKCMEERL